jgi:hypothetical protein
MMSTVHINIPPPIGALAGLAIIACSLAILGVEIYKAQALLEDWDRTRDDADKGARGAEHAAEQIADLRQRLDVQPQPVAGPITEPMPAVLAEQTDEWRGQFTFSEKGRR